MSETPTPDETPAVDPNAVRRLAQALSKEHPETSPEENWLLAESQLRAKEAGRRDAEQKAAEDSANLMAKLEMDVYGHP